MGHMLTVCKRITCTNILAKWMGTLRLIGFLPVPNLILSIPSPWLPNL